MPKDIFGFRNGSVKSKAAHAYYRPSGATVAEATAAGGGSTQFNVLRELKNAGWKIDAHRERSHTGHWVLRFYAYPSPLGGI